MEIIFEKLTEEHASSFLSIWQDQDVIQYTYIRNIHSIEDARVKIQRYLSYPHGLLGPFVIKKDSDVIGLAAGMSPEKSPDTSEIFFHLAKIHWGKGYGSRAIDFLLYEGFNKKKLKRIQAQAVVSNNASWQLLEKKGFLNKKLHKNAYRDEMDIYEYSLTREEYQAL